MIAVSAWGAVVGEPPAWPTWIDSSHRRRVDPLVRSAAAAVDQALAGRVLASDTALVVATSYGAIDATWRLATSIAEHGDAAASPTPFTVSVHSSCASALGECLGLHGPCTTLSQGHLGVTAALRWAELILSARRAPAVLLVAADRHNAWSRGVVQTHIAETLPVGDGAAALLLAADGPRRLRWDAPPVSAVQCDAGAPGAADEAWLAAWPGPRRRAADYLRAWWPLAGLATIDAALWRSATPIRLAGAENGRSEACWLTGHT